MEKSKFSKPLDENLGASIRSYINMQVDRAALKGAEKMSLLSNKAIVTVILLLVGTIFVFLLGIAAGYFFGGLLGSLSLGFLCAAALVLAAGIAVFLLRKKLFINELAKMYSGMLLGDDRTSNMKELNLRQQFVETRIQDKEEDIAAEYKMLKNMLNPFYYLSNVADKIRDIFRAKDKDTPPAEDIKTASSATRTGADDVRASEEADKGSDQAEENYQNRQF